jgi:Tat protein secretion system quality control protein TatD with DNase activity
MNNLFDIACNFSSERFDKDLDLVIERAQHNGVNKFLISFRIPQ